MNWCEYPGHILGSEGLQNYGCRMATGLWVTVELVVISVLIVAEASLSFLGLGIHPPAATWGNMIAEAQAKDDTMAQHPFILLVPGTALFLTVFAFNLLGERAQAKWDPRGSKL